MLVVGSRPRGFLRVCCPITPHKASTSTACTTWGERERGLGRTLRTLAGGGSSSTLSASPLLGDSGVGVIWSLADLLCAVL